MNRKVVRKVPWKKALDLRTERSAPEGRGNDHDGCSIKERRGFQAGSSRIPTGKPVGLHGDPAYVAYGTLHKNISLEVDA